MGTRGVVQACSLLTGGDERTLEGCVVGCWDVGVAGPQHGGGCARTVRQIATAGPWEWGWLMLS